MRRALAASLGAVALIGILSAPAHAGGTGTGLGGALGSPLKLVTNLGPLHLGRLPLLDRR
ncbi:hypothetical protein ACFC0M_24830 [Streptomyces sp. NPDC056149]|uniref:hypothetical protein n=1 Tax=unclassified Streptomyces TaxID=2593676 RepID=UPI00238183B0|nr:hypothetical protein [Streptomyces sp. WZ-12]